MELRAGNPSNQNPGSSTLNGRFLHSSTLNGQFLLELSTESIEGGPGPYISRGVPIRSKSNYRLALLGTCAAFDQPIEQTINMSIHQSIDASHHRFHIDQSSD